MQSLQHKMSQDAGSVGALQSGESGGQLSAVRLSGAARWPTRIGTYQLIWCSFLSFSKDPIYSGLLLYHGISLWENALYVAVSY